MKMVKNWNSSNESISFENFLFIFNFPGSEVGTVITTITANDVDTNPAITYKFAQDGNPLNMFSIDKFSGKITLAMPLDHEERAEYMLKVITYLRNVKIKVLTLSVFPRVYFVPDQYWDFRIYFIITFWIFFIFV